MIAPYFRPQDIELEEHEFDSAYQIANANTSKHATSSVPYSHLVNVFQAALGNFDEVLILLKKSGYENEVKDQPEEIKNELMYIKSWLEDWAPDEVKFELQKTLPDVNLTNEQKDFLAGLANAISTSSDNKDGQYFHSLIYEKREEFGLKPTLAFKAIYKVLLGKDSGPKAGMFLSILDKDFLISRFKLES